MASGRCLRLGGTVLVTVVALASGANGLAATSGRDGWTTFGNSAQRSADAGSGVTDKA